MTQVKLLGELGEKFGADWTSADSSVRDILRLIDCQTEGFKEYIAECHDKNIQFTIQNGDEFIDAEDLTLPILKDTVIITPIPAGSGKGLGKIIAGLLLLTAMFFLGPMAGLFEVTAAAEGVKLGALAGQGMSAAGAIKAGATLSLTWAGSAVMMLGANLALAGIQEMSAPDAGEMVSDPSYLFNGAKNNIEQGQPVPVLYGTMKIGGTAISQGFQTGELKGSHLNYETTTASGYYYGSSSGTTASSGGTNSDSIITQFILR